MPSMANITVKKNDGTTDIVFSALTPSSGDNVSAVWRSETAAIQNNCKPTLTMTARSNADKSGRRVVLEARFPQYYTETTTGLLKVANTVPISASFLLPQSMPQAMIDEAVSQFANLLTSTLVKDSLKAGIAPT